jgi:hypothetical protein
MFGTNFEGGQSPPDTMRVIISPIAFTLDDGRAAPWCATNGPCNSTDAAPASPTNPIASPKRCLRQNRSPQMRVSAVFG